MEQQLTASAPATPEPVPLDEHIARLLFAERNNPALDFEGQDEVSVQLREICTNEADKIMLLLTSTGHVLPGAPPAQRIFEDAKRFHDQLTLTALALRILNMLAFNNVQTPETKPARKWIDDYLQGVNHGPAGQAMLWPGRLPGMAAMLRDWGFVPTIALPGQPSYVARAQPNPTVQ